MPSKTLGASLVLGLELHELDIRMAEEQGVVKGLRIAVNRLCVAFGVELDDQRRQALAGMSDTELDALHGTILRERRWPG